MCGRFALTRPAEEVAVRFGAQQVLFQFGPRYNIAPSQPVAVITHEGERILQAMRWGLVPFWAKDPSIGNRLINARAETLLEKPSFKYAFTRRRCLVPADGFFEWRKEDGRRSPVYIRRRDGGLFAFAGLWEEWQSPDGSPLRTCTIITTEPNALIAPIHHRMAVILRPEDEALWLDHSVREVKRLMALLQPYPAEELEAYPVSPRVNNPAHDDPSCIQPA
ncbi:MAG: SOS response-associated peptidase [Armatimonadota bacterium]|nr:SOS response-associated peptidase [Armatimonadota bacterium]